MTTHASLSVGQMVRMSLPGSWVDGREAVVTNPGPVWSSDDVCGVALQVFDAAGKPIGVTVVEPEFLTRIGGEA